MPYVTETEYSKMIDDVVKAQKAEDAARAEITQLRAELAEERELADRLAGLAERAQYALKQVLAGKPVRDADEIIASLSALAAHTNRRNK